jgi:hypothetical protein
MQNHADAAITFVSLTEPKSSGDESVPAVISTVADPDTTEMSAEQKAAAQKEMEQVEKEIEMARKELEEAMKAQDEAREKMKEAVEKQRQLMYEHQELMDDQMKEVIIKHTKGHPGSPSVIIKRKPGDRKDAPVHVYRWNDDEGEVTIEIEDDIIIDGDSLESFIYEIDIDSLDVMPFGYFFGDDDRYVLGDFDYDFDFDEYEDALKEYQFNLQDHQLKMERELDRLRDHQMPYKEYLDQEFFELHRDKTERIIRQELIDDDLIEREGDYVIELNGKDLLINGEKQPRKVYQKYKRLFESMEDDTLDGDFKYKMVL